MRTLKYRTYILNINGRVINKERFLCYTDKTDPEILFETNSFDEAYERLPRLLTFVFTNTGLLNKKRYIRFYDDKITSESDFESATVIREYEEAMSPGSYTFAYLSENLPANEFCQWLKDNGVAVQC